MAQKSILIIDDTPENIDLLAGILKPEFTVKAATSGRIGLKIASARPLILFCWISECLRWMVLKFAGF